MTEAKPQPDAIHLEEAGAITAHDDLGAKSELDERMPEAKGRNIDAMPKGYFYSPLFIGSFCAIGFGFMSATGGYALVAPLLGEINADIGPSPNLTWVALAYLLCSAIVFLLVGRLSDIFGRRWFFIVGSVIGLIGSILGATAQSIDQLIGAEVFIGIAAGFQVSFFWVVGEIVPMKYRYLANSAAYAFTIPTNPLAAKIGLTFQTQTSVKWRGCFYFMIGVNVISIFCWYFFYHPPTFKMLHRRTAAKQLLRDFDWIGLTLYTGSTFIFLMGLTWGGSLYPWKSAQVLGVLVGGVVGFAVFIIWEIYLPIGSEPFLPLHLFRNLRYMACAWLTAVGAATYFGFSLIWPSAVAVLYTDLSDSHKATLSGLAAMGFVFGQIAGGFVGTLTGPRPGIIACMTIAAPVLMAAAANPINMNLTMGLVATGTLFIGMMEGMAIATTTFPLRTQEEIGTAGGLSGTIRSFGSVIAVAVLSATLKNRLATTIPAIVVPAAENAGLPTASIPALISGLGGLTALNNTTVPGLTTDIMTTALHAYKVANSQAYSTVFLVSFAFGGIGMIICWFVAQNDASLDTFVAGYIHKTSEEKALETDQV
ncbi:hypothetical protein LTR66_002152 [Elasticomyces elasticus]|nr:hypothetical protein LTR66_002152 [Elasticomyces elasticus]